MDFFFKVLSFLAVKTKMETRVMMAKCWESLLPAVFEPLLNHIRMGPGSGTLPNQEIKSPCNQCWIYHLVWVSFLVSGVTSTRSPLLKACRSFGMSQLHCCICPPLRGDKVLPLGHKTGNTVNSLCWSLREIPRQWETNTHSWSCSCSVFSLRE